MVDKNQTATSTLPSNNEVIDEALSFSADLKAEEQVKINRWKLIALFLGSIAFLLATAITLMMPLKQTIVKVLEYDRTTGRTEIQQIAETNKIREIELVKHYNIHKYVKATENYFFHDHDERFAIVAAMSSKEVYQHWQEENTKRNPNSLYNVLGDTASIKVDVKSIQKLENQDDTWIVRFDKELKDNNVGSKPKRVPYIGTYAIRFINDAAPPEDAKESNPIGSEFYARQIN